MIKLGKLNKYWRCGICNAVFEGPIKNKPGKFIDYIDNLNIDSKDLDFSIKVPCIKCNKHPQKALLNR